MSTMSTSTRLWPRFEEVLRRQRLMERMMQTSGVDVPMAIRVDGGLAFIEARGKCRYCLHEESCRVWLDSCNESQTAPDFCPNARFFAACRRHN
jgi:hypothetical protein